jgi:3-hydroxy-9,10-secoandrosta-1,3,5(10)-triene-9,17-dione monooxygenase reductase component
MSTPTCETAAATGSAVREFMRHWATGMAVITSGTAERPVGCTVNAFISVSLDPPLLLVSLNRSSRTLAAMTAHGAFGVNVLGRGQLQVAASFAAASGDRFRGVPFRMIAGVPILDETIAAAACKLNLCVPVADHVLVIAAPHWCVTHDDDGDTLPLVFFAGQYMTTATAGGSGSRATSA